MVNGQRTAGEHIISGMALHAPLSRYVVERFIFSVLFNTFETLGYVTILVIIFPLPAKIFLSNLPVFKKIGFTPEKGKA
jgi:hypothetical protein